MPTASSDGVSLYYAVEGSGQAVVFVTEAGLGGWSWGWQHGAVSGPYRSVVWDLRGTGRSERPPGPYALETLVRDFESVLAAVEARNAHVVGAGLGGAVALRAARTSARVETVTAIGTGARGGAFGGDPLVVSPSDPEALRDSTETLLSSDFRASQPDVVDGIVEWRRDGDAEPAGARAQLAALEGFDATDWGYEVTAPVLVVHGTDDALVPHDSAQSLAASLPKGELLSVEGAGHLPQVERSRLVNDRILGFLETHTDE